MKKLTTLVIALLLICFQNGFAQVENVPENAIMINENTVIKDVDGNKVEFPEFMEIMDSGEWTLEPVLKKNGEVDFIQLKKATEEDKKMMKTMPKPGGTPDVIGQKAPDFSITDLNGNHISLDESEGKVVVLNFWFTACKPCIQELPELNEVYQKYATNDEVVFASITFNKAKEVKKFLKQNSILYPVVSDSKDICDLFKVQGFPTNIVIDKDGNYLDYISGGFPGIGSHITKSIEEALARQNDN